MPDTVGVPLMVNTPPEKVPVTPAGNPVTVTPVAPPPAVYVIVVIGVLMLTVWFVVPGADVRTKVTLELTVMMPLNAALPHPPVVVTVYGKVPVAVGVPLMVKTPPEKVPVTPAGKPVTVAPVALPPIV